MGVGGGAGAAATAGVEVADAGASALTTKAGAAVTLVRDVAESELLGRRASLIQ